MAWAMAPLLACQSGGLAEPPRSATSTALGRTASYDSMACWFDVNAPYPISCGQLVVPEDWNHEGGRQLHLPIVTFHTASAWDRAEPVVYLSGGPGGRSRVRTDVEIDRWVDFLRAEPWTRAHDVIVIAQRGTTWTDSDLSCPTLSDPLVRVNAGAAPGAWTDWRERLDDAVIACEGHLVEQGHQLGAYNMSQAARDVAALRVLLGLETWSIYGISYGTRYALTVMRNHPEGIRSAILDSPYPPQTATPGLSPDGVMGALDQVLEACAADALCGTKYPNLREDLKTVLARLAAEPIHLPVVNRDGSRTLFLEVDDVELTDVVVSYLRENDGIGLVPNLIEEIKDRPETFAAGYRDLLFDSEDPDSAEGAYMSIFCNDDFASVNHAEWAAQAERYPMLRDWILTRPFATPCASWPVKAVDPADKQPVSSDIPTLILAGALDPVTPVVYARATAATLSTGHLLVFPGRSHGVLSYDSCASEVIEAFLARPRIRPKIDCEGAEMEFSPSLNARAEALLDEGDDTGAERLLLEVLTAQKDGLEAGHRSFAYTYRNMGKVHLERGEYALAEPLFKKAMIVGWKTRGSYDPGIAVSAFYLARVYRKQGRREEAEAMYLRALRIEEAAYGPEHPELVTTLEAYADLLRELGRKTEALELETRARAIDRG